MKPLDRVLGLLFCAIAALFIFAWASGVVLYHPISTAAVSLVAAHAYFRLSLRKGQDQ
jgi:hypothetical protein